MDVSLCIGGWCWCLVRRVVCVSWFISVVGWIFLPAFIIKTRSRKFYLALRPITMSISDVLVRRKLKSLCQVKSIKVMPKSSTPRTREKVFAAKKEGSEVAREGEEEEEGNFVFSPSLPTSSDIEIHVIMRVVAWRRSRKSSRLMNDAIGAGKSWRNFWESKIEFKTFLTSSPHSFLLASHTSASFPHACLMREALLWGGEKPFYLGRSAL